MNSNRRSNGHQRRVMDLRRSNAAQPHKNRKSYSRKAKHKARVFD